MSQIKKILLKVLGPIILSKSKIVSNERLSPHFQFITIKGSSIKKKEWVPGQKIQIQLKGDEMRSYTPSSWNQSEGVMQTLIYMHGKGPGAIWARDVRAQDKVTVLGPKSSLRIDEGVKRVLFFGDETTYGLAYALLKNRTDIEFHFFFEANDLSESLLVLKKFELEQSTLFELNQMDAAAKALQTAFVNDGSTKIILSGKQQSIVALRQRLYAQDIPKDFIDKKVYWGWKDDPNGKLKK